MALQTNPMLTGEPSSPLKATLALRADLEISDGGRNALGDLALRVHELRKGKPAISDWLEVYSRSIEVVRGLADEVDQRMNELAVKIPSQDMISGLSAQQLAGPKKEAEQARARLKNAIKTISDEWKERLKRQADEQVMLPVMAYVRENLKVAEQPSEHGLVFFIHEGWLRDFIAYLSSCFTAWVDQVRIRLELQLKKSVQEASSVSLAKGASVGEPSSAQPVVEVPHPDGQPPFEEVDIPKLPELILQALRADLMVVVFLGGLMATISGVVLYLLQQSQKIQRDSRFGAILTALLLPILLVLAIFSSRKQRDKIIIKARQGFNNKAEAWLRDVTQKAISRQQSRLQQLLNARVQAWDQALEGWWEQAVGPNLKALESETERKTTELRQSASQLTNEQGQLKTYRGKLQQLLTELRKRKQEILDETLGEQSS